MLKVSALSGKWRVSGPYGWLLSVGGTAYGLHDQNFTVLFCLPADSSAKLTTVNYDGIISTGPPNSQGDKDCTHMKLVGNLLDAGGKISQTFVDPTGGAAAGYIGPSFKIPRWTFSTEQGSFSSCGAVFFDLPADQVVLSPPDHSWGKYSFTNCSLRLVSKGPGQYRLAGTYTETYKGISKTYTEEYGGATIDTVNFRYKNGNTWYSFRTITNTKSVPALTDSRITYAQFNDVLRYVDVRKPDFALVTGDLSRRCANDASILDMNNIENLVEIAQFSEGFKAFRDLMKKKVSAESLAELYLSYKYGARLTVSDLEAIYRSLPTMLARSARTTWFSRARETVQCPSLVGKATIQYNYKVYYNPVDTGLTSLINKAWDVGLFPSLQNAWDLIPLSFVVDWFTKIGDRLTQYDAATKWATLNVVSSLLSEKLVVSEIPSWVLYPGRTTLFGNITLIQYNRHTLDYVIPPVYHSDTPLDFKNYPEAVALLVARRGKNH